VLAKLENTKAVQVHVQTVQQGGRSQTKKQQSVYNVERKHHQTLNLQKSSKVKQRPTVEVHHVPCVM
jgi:hypothetical protein